MASIRPKFSSLSLEVIEWCQNLKILEEKLEKNQSQNGGEILLNMILIEEEFLREVLILSNNPLTYSLTTAQFHLIKAACLVIRKTRLCLQRIEECTPINAQPALFHAFIYYGQDLIGGDPRTDPVILFHRWTIRSKYKHIDFGYEFDKGEKSVKLLENLYQSLSKEFEDSATSTDVPSPTSISIHNIFRCQLAYELGEYYFSADKRKSIEYLCKCRLSDDKYFEEYNSFCDVNISRVDKLIRAQLEVLTVLSPEQQINHFIQFGQDYEGIFLVMLRALLDNISLRISKDFRNMVVYNAFNKGQKKSAIKISICNAFELPPGSSSEEMINLVPEQCFHHLNHNFDERIIEEIVKLIKTLYGNFPGSKMSESQKNFVSSFFKNIDNSKVWKILKKIEGFEFVQYPLEHFFDEIAQFSLKYKNYKSGNLELIDDTSTNKLDVELDSLLKELNLVSPERHEANNDVDISIEEVNLNQTKQQRWLEITDSIKKLREDLDVGNIEEIENLCIDTLDKYGIMEFQILKDLSCELMEFCRWQFLKQFLKNVQKLRLKDEFKNKIIEHFRFCKIMTSCIGILEPFTEFSQDISNGFDATMYKKQFDIMSNISSDDIKNLRAYSMKFFKALSSRGIAYKEHVFEVIANLVHQKWIHQVIGSMLAGYLCGRQRDQKLKQVNPMLYGPLTIIMMPADCAVRYWPDISFRMLQVLNENIKPIRFDLSYALMQLCFESRKNNFPKYIYELRLADLYHLQGFTSKSLRSIMNAFISHSSFYMNMKNIEDNIWHSYAIPKMIQCCLSKKEMIAALVWHQFIRGNVTWQEKYTLTTKVINNGILQSSIFTRFIYETKLLLHVVDTLHKEGELSKCSQIIEWLKSSIQEETPSIANSSYISFDASLLSGKHGDSTYRLKKKLVGVDIDPNYRKVKIDELQFEFLKTFSLWIDEQLKL
ncbi:17745_t:CDS:10 [Funneliformis geosporum]|uniref:14109_t:CDS:1 n=1 Tax=Funneliformis geosporum TaxID=1117311 RepID=A0A9W4SJH9_9GLOM|nr:17745_t:CDS:10 [Funneliformis geosporum]CAI2172193.1 14109_t:CDS:10 [Funneliformis geosporum]